MLFVKLFQYARKLLRHNSIPLAIINISQIDLLPCPVLSKMLRHSIIEVYSGNGRYLSYAISRCLGLNGAIMSSQIKRFVNQCKAL